MTGPTATSVENAKLVQELRRVVGARYVLTSPASTRRFRKGFRFGDGPALGVVRPGSLVEQWRVLKVGHLYFAKPALANHYRALDPSNSFNPGLGHTSKCVHWK